MPALLTKSHCNGNFGPKVIAMGTLDQKSLQWELWTKSHRNFGVDIYLQQQQICLITSNKISQHETA